MLTCRPLTTADHPQLLEIVNLRPETLNGYTDEQFQKSIPILVTNWLNDPLCFAVGMFSDDTLDGAMIALESQYSPSWTWVYWLSRPGLFTKYLKDNETATVFKSADTLLFDEMEVKRKLNRFFVSYRSSNAGLKGTGMSPRLFEIMKRHYDSRVARYQFITDCVIPANQEAKYAYQREIQGNRTWPDETEIRLGVLVK
jgi:hypothetical protein